jgi:hypothetical protein
LDGVGL